MNQYQIRCSGADRDGETVNKSKKFFWIAVLTVCVTVAAVGVFLLIRSLTASPAIKREDVTSPTSAAASSSSAFEGSETPTEAENAAFGYEMADPGNLNVDFDRLKSVNPDIYAWIYIPNTQVDYAVVRGERDNSDTFYLDHNVQREYQFSGSIFSELVNHPDMQDRITIFYGHNMRDGSMFATLHNFEDADFFNKNTTAFVVTEDKIFTYLIYSAYLYDDRHILHSYRMEDDASFLSYLDSTLHPHSYLCQVRDNVTLNVDNRILTLSTCADSSGTRFLVQGVLVHDQEK